MLRVYPFPEGEPRNLDYLVTYGDMEIPLHTARVSAYPINRRWPGHQRSKDQTELVPFASFALDGSAELTIRPVKPFQEVIVRPLSKGVQPVVTDGVVTITLPEPGAYTVEFDGYHDALHLFADPVKTYDVDPTADDVIYFGKGLHEVGLIKLHSNQTLFIDEGAIVFGRVYARDASHIRILGHGILDASHVRAVLKYEMPCTDGSFAALNSLRWDTIRLEYCDHVEIDGVTVRDSLIYNIRPICCTDLVIDHFKTIGNWRYNSDGIDMHNCQGVRIRNCFIRTYDDSICVKGFDYGQDESDMCHNGRMYDVFDDIIVEKCVIWCDWGRCLEIGAETRAREIKNVLFRDCDIIRNTHIACDVQNVDYADVHDVTFENIRVEHDPVCQRTIMQRTDDETFQDDPNSDAIPQLLGSYVIYVLEYSAGGTIRGKNHDIVFRNIFLTANVMPPSSFRGYSAENQSSRIRIEGLYWNGRRIQTLEEANVQMNEYTSDVTIQ